MSGRSCCLVFFFGLSEPLPNEQKKRFVVWIGVFCRGCSSFEFWGHLCQPEQTDFRSLPSPSMVVAKASSSFDHIDPAAAFVIASKTCVHKTDFLFQFLCFKAGYWLLVGTCFFFLNRRFSPGGPFAGPPSTKTRRDLGHPQPRCRYCHEAHEKTLNVGRPIKECRQMVKEQAEWQGWVDGKFLLPSQCWGGQQILNMLVESMKRTGFVAEKKGFRSRKQVVHA